MSGVSSGNFISPFLEGEETQVADIVENDFQMSAPNNDHFNDSLEDFLMDTDICKSQNAPCGDIRPDCPSTDTEIPANRVPDTGSATNCDDSLDLDDVYSQLTPELDSAIQSDHITTSESKARAKTNDPAVTSPVKQQSSKSYTHKIKPISVTRAVSLSQNSVGNNSSVARLSGQNTPASVVTKTSITKVKPSFGKKQKKVVPLTSNATLSDQKVKSPNTSPAQDSPNHVPSEQTLPFDLKNADSLPVQHVKQAPKGPNKNPPSKSSKTVDANEKPQGRLSKVSKKQKQKSSEKQEKAKPEKALQKEEKRLEQERKKTEREQKMIAKEQEKLNKAMKYTKTNKTAKQLPNKLNDHSTTDDISGVMITADDQDKQIDIDIDVVSPPVEVCSPHHQGKCDDMELELPESSVNNKEVDDPINEGCENKVEEKASTVSDDTTQTNVTQLVHKDSLKVDAVQSSVKAIKKTKVKKLLDSSKDKSKVLKTVTETKLNKNPAKRFGKILKTSCKSTSSDCTQPKRSKIAKRKAESSPASEPKSKRSKPTNYSGPVWVQCEIVSCRKWRNLKLVSDPSQIPEKWTCSMNDEPNYSSCAAPEEVWSDLGDSQEFIESPFIPGSLVWAKMSGYPWWPAIVEEDPDDEAYYRLGHSNNLVPVEYHVVFLDTPVCRVWVHPGYMQTFEEFTDPNEENKVSVPKKYTKSLKESKKKALKALGMSVKDRLELFSFSKRNGVRNRKRKSLPEEGEKQIMRKRKPVSKSYDDSNKENLTKV